MPDLARVSHTSRPPFQPPGLRDQVRPCCSASDGSQSKNMRICVFGAGAVGGLIATRFALAGEDVTIIDRGPHLAAIKSNGIKLQWQDGSVEIAKVNAVDKAAAAGKQDLVLLAVKAHSLEQIAKD